MLEVEKKGNYVSIFSDGTIRQKVAEGTDGAVLREYETSDGLTGKKWELVFNSIRARITGVDFIDGDYGTNLLLTFSEGGKEDIILSVPTASPFGEDVMKKLPNVDFSKSLWFKPYAFTDDKEKLRKGVTIMQGADNKIENFFFDKVNKKNLHGFPEPEGDEKNSDDWKIYFAKARKFLVKYTEANIKPKFGEKTADPLAAFDDSAYTQDAPNPDDIPF